MAASTAALSADDAWNELLEKDDRNSPEDYPEMCLITVEELRDFMRRATSRDEGCTVSRHGRDTATDGAA